MQKQNEEVLLSSFRSWWNRVRVTDFETFICSYHSLSLSLPVCVYTCIHVCIMYSTFVCICTV